MDVEVVNIYIYIEYKDMLYACICVLLLYAFQSSLLSKFFVNYYILQTKLGYGFYIYINGWSAFKGLPR